MTLTNLPSPNFTGADLRDRVNAAVTEARAARRFATVAALLADTTLAYGAGSRSIAAGDVVEAGGHRYAVAASAATDQDVMTAGGVRLHVQAIHAALGMAVEAFGWVADNSQARASANAAAAQKAIDAAHARAGGRVLFPGGVGYVNATLLLERSTLLRGGAWLPDGTPSTIELADGSNCDLVRTKYAGASYVYANDKIHGGGIDGLTLDGNRAGQSGANDPVTGQLPVGINAKHWILGRLERIRVTSCVGYGIWWGGDVNTCVWEQVQSVRNGRSGVYVNNASVNTTAIACNFENNDDYGVEFGVMAADTNGMVFVGCAWEYNRKGDVNFINGNRAGVSFISPRSLGVAYTGGAMTASSATLTIASGQTYQFQASDVGALVHVPGAGASGANLITTIAAYTSPTQVTLAATAGTTVAGARVCQGVIWRYPSAAPAPALNVIDGFHCTDRPVAIHDQARGRTDLASRDLLANYSELTSVHAGRGTWNEGHLMLGDYRLWVDSTGDLRIKNGAPTSDTDGAVVGAQT